MPHVEAARERVAEADFVLRGKNRPKRKPRARKGTPSKRRSSSDSVHVTISAGLAERDDGNATTEAVLEAADKALYRAKKAGRNCVKT